MMMNTHDGMEGQHAQNPNDELYPIAVLIDELKVKHVWRLVGGMCMTRR